MKNKNTTLKKQVSAWILLCAVFFQLPFLAGFAPAPVTFEGEQASSLAQSGPEAELPAAPEESLRGSGLYMPDGFEVQAAAAYLVNEETGTVLYAKNENQPLVMASLVKMMTCILLVENAPDLDTTTITANKSWIYDELYGKNASTADIRLGETLTARELLYAMLLPSANEAALLAADYVSGGYMKNFLYMMNTRAQSLGCTNTVFVDANGLSEGNLTTAKDMYLITKAFMSYPVLVEIAGVPTYEMAAHEKHSGPYFIQTTNKLIAPNSAYAEMMKATTSLVKAGKTGSLGVWQNFASMAQRPGETYYCVVLNTPNEADVLGASLDIPQQRPALYETALLYNWAFSQFSIRGVMDITQPITEVRVKYSTEADVVRLLPSRDLMTVLKNDTDESVILKTFDVPEAVDAPVKKGDVIGKVTLYLGGQVIGDADLIAADNVQRNNTLYSIRKVQEFFGSTFFRVLLVVLVVLVAGYGLLVAMAHKNKRKRKNWRR